MQCLSSSPVQPSKTAARQYGVSHSIFRKLYLNHTGFCGGHQLLRERGMRKSNSYYPEVRERAMRRIARKLGIERQAVSTGLKSLVFSPQHPSIEGIRAEKILAAKKCEILLCLATFQYLQNQRESLSQRLGIPAISHKHSLKKPPTNNSFKLRTAAHMLIAEPPLSPNAVHRIGSWRQSFSLIKDFLKLHCFVSYPVSYTVEHIPKLNSVGGLRRKVCAPDHGGPERGCDVKQFMIALQLVVTANGNFQ